MSNFQITHNTTEKKLEFALDVGGVAMPSLAALDVNKLQLDNYGNITLLFNKDYFFDEKGRVKKSIAESYKFDAYTVRSPEIVYARKEKEIRNHLKDRLKGIKENILTTLEENNPLPKTEKENLEKMLNFLAIKVGRELDTSYASKSELFTIFDSLDGLKTLLTIEKAVEYGIIKPNTLQEDLFSLSKEEKNEQLRKNNKNKINFEKVLSLYKYHLKGGPLKQVKEENKEKVFDFDKHTLEEVYKHLGFDKLHKEMFDYKNNNFRNEWFVFGLSNKVEETLGFNDVALPQEKVKGVYSKEDEYQEGLEELSQTFFEDFVKNKAKSIVENDWLYKYILTEFKVRQFIEKESDFTKEDCLNFLKKANKYEDYALKNGVVAHDHKVEFVLKGLLNKLSETVKAREDIRKELKNNKEENNAVLTIEKMEDLVGNSNLEGGKFFNLSQKVEDVYLNKINERKPLNKHYIKWFKNELDILNNIYKDERFTQNKIYAGKTKLGNDKFLPLNLKNLQKVMKEEVKENGGVRGSEYSNEYVDFRVANFTYLRSLPISNPALKNKKEFEEIVNQTEDLFRMSSANEHLEEVAFYSFYETEKRDKEKKFFERMGKEYQAVFDTLMEASEEDCADVGREFLEEFANGEMGGNTINLFNEGCNWDKDVFGSFYETENAEKDFSLFNFEYLALEDEEYNALDLMNFDKQKLIEFLAKKEELLYEEVYFSNNYEETESKNIENLFEKEVEEAEKIIQAELFERITEKLEQLSEEKINISTIFGALNAIKVEDIKESTTDYIEIKMKGIIDFNDENLKDIIKAVVLPANVKPDLYEKAKEVFGSKGVEVIEYKTKEVLEVERVKEFENIDFLEEIKLKTKFEREAFKQKAEILTRLDRDNVNTLKMDNVEVDALSDRKEEVKIELPMRKNESQKSKVGKRYKL